MIAQTSTQNPQSLSEDDSGSELDSESDTPPTNPRIKPLTSKPTEEDPPKATNKPRSKLGMIEYTTKKRSNPLVDMNAFYDFIKKLLYIDVSKTQLSEKVRKLKKKYENNASKSKMGDDRTFSKSHEQKAYELSKKIWFSASTTNSKDAN
ncbi:putative transcription factor [Camellia lanceoleosa]|uniref:Transcription factor n=1 Tax=Camellia lanceoleosa TaxID=1840588 RepID=A0ACC0IK08_9ERIC|nr:putative transcription factor [Camellia lanceoleosa]